MVARLCAPVAAAEDRLRRRAIIADARQVASCLPAVLEKGLREGDDRAAAPAVEGKKMRRGRRKRDDSGAGAAESIACTAEPEEAEEPIAAAPPVEAAEGRACACAT